MRKIQVLIYFLIGLQLSSCIPHERLVNFRENQDRFETPEAFASLSEVSIQPNDRIQIQVSALNQEAAEPYNENLGIQGGGGGNQQFLIGYLVDPDGFISYPRLGKIKMGGLTRFEAKQKIEQLLEPYLQEPVVKIGIVNFKVTVFGEVGNSAVINVENERISIVEAMAQAGLTPYSNRGEIWVIREQDGKRVFGTVNLYARDVFDSPYFYLRQNDVIYVEPTRDKVTSIRQPFLSVIPWVTSVITLGTLIFTVINNR